MFYKPYQLNLTSEDVIEICEQLWSEENISNCPDCNVKPNQQHIEGCDVARCTLCKTQRLCCDCEEGDDGECDIWTGLWPGVEECYKHKLICFDTATNSYMFDLNSYILMMNK